MINSLLIGSFQTLLSIAILFPPWSTWNLRWECRSEILHLQETESVLATDVLPTELEEGIETREVFVGAEGKCLRGGKGKRLRRGL